MRRVWHAVAPRRRTELAALVFSEHQNNGYGVKDRVVSAFAEGHRRGGSAELQRLFRAEYESLPPSAGDGYDTTRSMLADALKMSPMQYFEVHCQL